MSINTLETSYANGQVVDASHINELTLALLGVMVGRNTSGIPTPSQNLGSLAIPYGNFYADGIILGGFALDVSQVTAAPNRIVSGKTRALSSSPDFLRANGSALEFDVLGLTKDLVLTINNTATSVVTDITKTGLSAAPAANNTAAVNDTTMTNDLYAGEFDAEIPDIIIDAALSEVTSLVGQTVAFKTPTGEIFTGFLKSTILITNVFRGYYFDDTGSPIVRGNLSNNDVLTLMKIGWVFVEDNGTTVDVTNLTPVYDFTAPSGPSTGQYWFDISSQVWKRFSGVTFEIIDRILIGHVISDATNTIAQRANDFSNQFRELNNVELEIDTVEIIKSKSEYQRVNVYGTELKIDGTKLSWNITTDLASPLSESASTYYTVYLTDKGEEVLDFERAYWRADLRGWYHPYHSWLKIGEIRNDSSSDIVRVGDNFSSSTVLFHTTNGNASTWTATRKFTTVAIHEGIDLETIESNTLGWLVKCRRSGDVVSKYSDASTVSTFFGLVLNKVTATQGMPSIVPTESRKSMQQSSANSNADNSFSEPLKNGDVISPVTEVGAGNQSSPPRAHMIVTMMRRKSNV